MPLTNSQYTRALALAALVRTAHRRINEARHTEGIGTPIWVLLRKEGWLA